jgi:hydroxyacylglutathione hydrolase
MLKYETLTLGELQTNCYLVWDDGTKEGVVIDPADEGMEISEIIENKHIKLKAILITHGHFDHVLGALDLKLIYKAPFYGSSLDQFLLERQKETAKYFLGREIKVPNFRKIDVDLDKTKEIKIGEEIIQIIKTPGHTPGGISFYYQKEGWLFDGDTLLAEGVEDTSHSYSSKEDLRNSIKKILSCPKGTLVLPGHGESFII